jgi:drug/metabolite transporter (DMT)-like permease
MDDSLTIAIIAGLGGMLGWGFADFFAKKTIDVIGDIASLVWAHSIASLILLVYIVQKYLSDSSAFPQTFEEGSIIFFFGGLQALVYILVYRGFGKGKLAVLNPVFSSYAGITALLSILIFNEVVNDSLLVGLGVVFAGILLVSMDIAGLKKKRLKLAGHPGLNEILLATVFAAIWTLFWAQFISGKDWKIYASLMYVSMSVIIIWYAFLSRAKLAVNKAAVWKFLLGIGIAEIVAYVSISYGFSETTRTSIIAVLSGAFALPVIILSRIFLQEKVDLVHRAGSFAIILGIVIISIA